MSLSVKFPVTHGACLKGNFFLISGGGGKAKTGIPNRVQLCEHRGSLVSERSHLDFEYRVQGLVLHPSRDRCFCIVGTECVEVSVKGKHLERTRSFSFTDEPQGGRRTLVLSRAGDRLVISDQGEFTLYRCSDFQRVRSFPSKNEEKVHTEAIKDAAFNMDGNQIATVDDSNLALWDLNTGKLVARASAPSGSKFAGCRFKGRQHLVTAQGGKGVGGVATWWALDGDKLTLERSVCISDIPITSFNLSPAGDILAAGTSEGGVFAVETNALQRAKASQLHDLGVAFLTFSNDAEMLLSGSMDTTVRITPTAELLATGGQGTLVAVVAALLLFVLIFFLGLAYL